MTIFSTILIALGAMAIMFFVGFMIGVAYTIYVAGIPENER